jgi:hypothetical protein
LKIPRRDIDFLLGEVVLNHPVFLGLSGYIRYYCKANIDRPWKFDKTVMSGFIVLPHFDLNTVPNAASPLVKDFSKNLGSIFKHGALNVKVG